MVSTSDPHTHVDVCSRIISLLTDNPSGNEIARAIALDFLLQFNVTKVRISGIRSDDSLIFLGDHGFSPSTTGKTEPATVWRMREDELMHVKIDKTSFGFNDERTCAAALLKIRGVTSGALAIYFAKPLSAKAAEELTEIVASLVGPLALFFFIRASTISIGSSDGPRTEEATSSHFTDRQLKILARMADGHTNHEIASALGFSVSTIRHETMRIFQLLSASDRHEASTKARELGVLQNA